MTTSTFLKNNHRSAAAILAAAAALVLTGCSNDIDHYAADDNTPTDNIVRFDIGVKDEGMTDEATTRAIYTTGNLGSSVTTDNYIFFQNNYSIGTITHGNDGWVANHLLWGNMDSTTNVIATFGAARYNEYANGQRGFFLPASISDQSNEVADFLFFMQKNFVPSSNGGRVRIEFTHKFSVVDIVVNFASSQTGAEVSNLKLGGTITDVKAQSTTFDSSGIPMLEAANRQYNGAKDLISAHRQSSTSSSVTYECSVIPQTVAAGSLSVSFTMNGKNYVWTSTKDMTFAEGKRNTITISVE